MIVILEDTKGFRKTIEVPRFMGQICLPIIRPFSMIVDFDDIKELQKATQDKLTFNFYKWIDRGNDIALYKEN